MAATRTAGRDDVRGLRNSSRRVLLGLLCIPVLLACAADTPSPALLVGDIAYAQVELGSLSPSQTERLAELTAFGLAVARQELAQVGEPYLERERDALVLQRLAAEVSVREAGMDEDRLREQYADSPEYELLVRHLVILSERWRSDEHRAEARAKAEAAHRRIRAGEDFAAVAGEVSDEPGAAERGGLLRPGRRGTWVPEFWEAASSLDVGEVSGVVETEYGFHILRLEERSPVPFEAVRGQVLGRLVDLAAAAEKAEAWAAREAQNVRVDPVAVAAWRSAPHDDALALATWPDGGYRGGDMRRYLLTLEPKATERLEAATDNAYRTVVAGLARNAFLVDLAAGMGVRLTADEAATVERKWVERAQGWALALGFRSGMSPEEVKAAAIAALAPKQQAAQIARGEVLALGPALRAWYPVVKPEPTPPTSSDPATQPEAEAASSPAASSSDAVNRAASG